ncbi:MAG: NUDIX hydrolase [Pseudomonadota bacterium]
MTDRTATFASQLSRLVAAASRSKRLQSGAICWREGPKGVEVLLVTTRRTGRWTPPKGTRQTGKSLARSAAAEAWEEAGVVGEIDPVPLGRYAYLKYKTSGAWEKRTVELYALKVADLSDDFPEAGERVRAWMPQADAAKAVRERGLARLIRAFAPIR